MADPDPDYPLIFEGQTLDAIRARMGANQNLGIDPDSPLFGDVEPGSFFGDMTGPVAIEHVEFYDTLNIAVAASHPSTSWGEHLDKWAESFGLERLDASPAGGFVTFGGEAAAVVVAGTIVATETVADDAEDVMFATLEDVILDGDGEGTAAVIAMEPGSAGNVPPGAVTIVESEAPGVATVINLSATTGGADIEDDASLLVRIDGEMAAPAGAGTAADYIRWSLAHSGIGSVTVVRGGLGPGTVLVYVLDHDHNPVLGPKLAELQADIDPVPGEGRGKAPVGAEVTVTTPGVFAALIAAKVEFETGYSLDGASGTMALREQIETAIYAYIRSLSVGGRVVLHKVVAAIVGVRGVADVETITLNGSPANLPTPADEVAVASTPTLTE